MSLPFDPQPNRGAGDWRKTLALVVGCAVAGFLIVYIPYALTGG